VHGLRGHPEALVRERIGVPTTAAMERLVADALGALDCDVIALQEGPSVDSMRRIAEAVGLHVGRLPSPVRWPGYVLSRFPLEATESFCPDAADPDHDPFSRSAGSLRIRLSHAFALRLVAVHLHPRRADLRAIESARIGAEIDRLERAGEPIVVAGDFNAEPDGGLHVELARRGFRRCDETGGGRTPTRLADGPRPDRVDHVYVDPGLFDAVRACGVATPFPVRQDLPDGRALYASDHLPVVVELALTA